MALTMTRTRTQTALTQLAKLVAEVHGELSTVESLIQNHPEHAVALRKRRTELESHRDAFYATIKQFNPELDPTVVGALDGWMRPYGRSGTKTAIARYLKSLSD